VLRTHSYDTGSAWMSLAYQGWMKGLVVHGMAGFNYDRAKTTLNVPDDFTVEAMAAVGRPDGVAGTAYDAAMDLVTGPELAELAREEPPPVLGHSDPNLANYLWDGARIWVVDFEDAGRSDVAYELATLVEHMAARETDWTAFCARFDVDPVRLRWCRQLCAAFWLYFLLRDRGSARGNPPDVLERQARRLLDLVDDRRARMPE